MEKRRLAWIGLIVCLSLFLMPCKAYAASTVDAVEPIAVSQKCTITVTYAHDGMGFPGVSISLYKIADVSSDYQYTLTDSFLGTGLRLNGVTSTGEWNTIRTTLESYIAANSVPAYAVRSTNAAGQVSFQDLAPGMYLIGAVPCSEDGFRYYFASVLAAAPTLNEDGTWNYQETITPKPDVENPTGEDLEYSVRKLWKDSGSTAKRPASIEIEILRNGETVKTVVLSEENNWSYCWYAEDDGSTWQVSEKNVPEGYVMTTDKRGTAFTVTNALPGKPGNSDAPKTGDVFNAGLYIMLLCISGAVLVILGATVKRKSE